MKVLRGAKNEKWQAIAMFCTSYNNKYRTRGGGRLSRVPASRRYVRLFVVAMRYERLLDVESLDEHLPRCVVDAEDGLVLLDYGFSCVRHLVGFRRHCVELVRAKCAIGRQLTQ